MTTIKPRYLEQQIPAIIKLLYDSSAGRQSRGFYKMDYGFSGAIRDVL